MADFDLGYLYYLHDKIQEARELEAGGSSLMSWGIILFISAIVLAYLFASAEFLLLALIGSVMLMIGINRHSRISKLHVEEAKKHAAEKAEKRVSIELHHQPFRPFAPGHIISGPSIIRHTLAKPFSEEIARHLKERGRIAMIIKNNSGSDINAIYKIYRLEGGSYDAEHFVKALHGLKKHGVVRVRKSISQTSRIPASST